MFNTVHSFARSDRARVRRCGSGSGYRRRPRTGVSAGCAPRGSRSSRSSWVTHSRASATMVDPGLDSSARPRPRACTSWRTRTWTRVGGARSTRTSAEAGTPYTGARCWRARGTRRVASPLATPRSSSDGSRARAAMHRPGTAPTSLPRVTRRTTRAAARGSTSSGP